MGKFPISNGIETITGVLLNQLPFRVDKMEIFSIFMSNYLFYSKKMCTFAGLFCKGFFIYAGVHVKKFRKNNLQFYRSILQDGY